jgi:hypothetical protein
LNAAATGWRHAALLGLALEGRMRPAALKRIGRFANIAAMMVGLFCFIERIALSI